MDDHDDPEDRDERKERDAEERRIRIADLLLRLRRVGITDQRIVSAIESVPRDLFVDAESHKEAYAERALPIACGQTISAPVVVGLMTSALKPEPKDKVLEIGTGSGYQACDPGPALPTGLHGRTFPHSGCHRRVPLQDPAARQYRHHDRRWHGWLARLRSLRQDHCHRRHAGGA